MFPAGTCSLYVVGRRMSNCFRPSLEPNTAWAALILIAASGTLFAGPSQWTPIGPEGGTLAALAADPQNPATVYAASCGGRMFKTDNGGASWIALGGLPNIDCNQNDAFPSAVLAVDPQNAQSLYAAKCSDI